MLSRIVANRIAKRECHHHYHEDLNGSCVIHLRLGDVLDSSGHARAQISTDAAEKMWLHGTEWIRNIGVYHRPKAFFQALLPTLRRETNTSGRIVLMGNVRAGDEWRAANGSEWALHGGHTQSYHYVKLVAAFLHDAGFHISQQLSDSDTCDSADCDLIRMASAPCFVPSGGGYTTLVSSVVAARGGHVIAAPMVTGIQKWVSADERQRAAQERAPHTPSINHTLVT